MTSKAKNPVIGSCPCPFAGCKDLCDVRKFATMHARDSGRRLAGKLYMICPTHGRIGMDGKPGAQEFMLENTTMLPGESIDPPATAPTWPKAVIGIFQR